MIAGISCNYRERLGWLEVLLGDSGTLVLVAWSLVCLNQRTFISKQSLHNTQHNFTAHPYFGSWRPLGVPSKILKVCQNLALFAMFRKSCVSVKLHKCNSVCYISVYVMWSSRMSRKSQILFLRYSQSWYFIMFLIVCSILLLFVSVEPIAQSLWGFHQIKA